MKLVIEDELVFKSKVETGSTMENLEDTFHFFSELSEICDEYSVNHDVHVNDVENVFKLYQQKIVLAEENMNTLMWRVIHFLYEDQSILEYVNRDDEFTIRISKNPEIFIDYSD